MALTINPAGSGTRATWITDTSFFFAGALLGALAAAAASIAVVGLMSMFLPHAVILLMVGTLGSMTILHEIGVSVPVPYSRRQVPEWWRSAMPMRVTSFVYGVALGLGFATPFVSSAHMIMVLSLPLVRPAWVAFVSVGAFALGKTIVLFLGAGTESHQDLLSQLPNREAARSRRWARRLTSVTAAALLLFVVVQPLRGR